MLNYFRWFGTFWRQYPFRMWGVLGLTILTIAVKTTFPLILKNIIDAMQGDFQVEPVLHLVWIYFLVGIVHEFLSKFLPFSRAATNLKLSALIRKTYYDLFTRKGFQFYQQYQTGDLLTRLTDDIDGQWDRIEWYSCSGVLRPIEAILILTFTLGVMFYYSWKLTLFSFCPLPFLVLILAKAQHKMAQCAQEKQKAISECNNLLETCFSGIRVVKSTQSEEDQIRKYEKALKIRIEREKDFLKINLLVHCLSSIANQVGTIIIIFVGGYFAIHQQLELGTFLLFIMYLERLIDPIWTLSWFYGSSRQVFTYVDRLRETEKFEDFEKPVAGKIVAESLPSFRSLEFRGVSFTYPGQTNPVLHHASFSISSEEIVALVGPIGAGKTTLLELIMGNLHPTEGEILLNGTPLQSFSLAERARYFGYVQQESVLFSDSIRNNLYLGDSLASSTLAKAMETSQMEAEIQQFPEKMETFLGHRGLSLSGGQKQRLSLARTLARSPQLLLLDDCTSAMDAATESRFWSTFKKNFPGSACVVITHRNATAKQAHHIIQVENGHTEAISNWEGENSC